MDIAAQDVRIDGFRAGRTARWYKATHLPTGTVVEFSNGVTSKREAMVELQRAVNAGDSSRQNQEQKP